MSDNVQWIVDLDATLDEAEALASKVKDWLVSQEIVSMEVSSELAYDGSMPLMRGARAIEWDSFDIGTPPLPCGLSRVTERRVFHSGGNGIDALQCPQCGHEHNPDVVPWSDAVGAWFNGESGDGMQCPACNATNSIVDWQFLECPWAFGNLGFGFWNWPIDDRLVLAVASVLGHRCRLVYEHN